MKDSKTSKENCEPTDGPTKKGIESDGSHLTDVVKNETDRQRDWW